MATQPLVAMGFKAPEFASPLNMMTQVSQLQAAQEANALRQLQAQQLMRAQEQENALRSRLSSGAPMSFSEAAAFGAPGLQALTAQRAEIETQEKRQADKLQDLAEGLMFVRKDPSLENFSEAFRLLKSRGLDMGSTAAEIMLMGPEERKKAVDRFIETTPGMSKRLLELDKIRTETEAARVKGEAAASQAATAAARLRQERIPTSAQEAQWLLSATPEQKEAFYAAKQAGRPTTTINMPQESELRKKLGGAGGNIIETGYKAAEDAVSTMDTINLGRDLLNKGMVTGFGADFLVNAGQALKQVGIDLNSDAAANAQTYAATLAGNVGRLISLFGAGTGLSNADREYAEKMAGGKISLDERALRRILDINERSARNVITKHNANVDRFKAGDEFKIEMPPERTSTLPPRDQQALDWARSNPTDPRSAQILKRLGME